MSSPQPQKGPRTRQAEQSIRRARTDPSAENIVNAISYFHTDLKADVAELKADVTVLKADVAELKADVAELKTNVAVLTTNVGKLLHHFGLVSGDTP